MNTELLCSRCIAIEHTSGKILRKSYDPICKNPDKCVIRWCIF